MHSESLGDIVALILFPDRFKWFWNIFLSNEIVLTRITQFDEHLELNSVELLEF